MKKCFTIDSYCSKYALCENKYNQFKKKNMQKPLANRVISISMVF